MNTLRAGLYEYGQVVPLGIGHVNRIEGIIEDDGIDLPGVVRKSAVSTDADWREDEPDRAQDKKTDRAFQAKQYRTAASDDAGRRPNDCSGRRGIRSRDRELRWPDFAAWLGFVPRQFSSGGKERFDRVSKAGQADIRRL